MNEPHNYGLSHSTLKRWTKGKFRLGSGSKGHWYLASPNGLRQECYCQCYRFANEHYGPVPHAQFTEYGLQTGGLQPFIRSRLVFVFHLYAEEGDTAKSCMYAHEGMSACPSSGECGYLIPQGEG